jgi:SAM-dependent methyltransferase
VKEPSPIAWHGANSQIDWNEFPVEAISLATFAKRNLIHLNLIRAAKRRATGGVLEVGVGSGAQSALLSRLASRVVTVDNNRRILRLANANLERFGRGVRSVAADAFRLPFPDEAFGVAISQGLMEHFEDDEIGALVREQLRVCRSVVFSVPSDNYPRRDMGNERLMPPQSWERIVSRAVDPGRFRIRVRYYRWDLEAVKFSALARRWLGSFSVLVTVDPRAAVESG